MKITLARPYEDASGKRHKADATVDLSRAEATNLLHIGAAREPAPRAKHTAPAPAADPAPKATERKDA